MIYNPHDRAGTKKERRMAESHAPPLQLNQFVVYFTVAEDCAAR